MDKDSKEAIKFYRQNNDYGEFSNFYPSPIIVDGLEWPTTEHYFQAQKFAHLPPSPSPDAESPSSETTTKTGESITEQSRASDSGNNKTTSSSRPRPVTRSGGRVGSSENNKGQLKGAASADSKRSKIRVHPYVEHIRVASSPGGAAKMGRNRAWPLRRDWEKIKDDVMRKCVLQKFLQHEDLQKVLLQTGDRQLIEHTKNDRYWADGGDGKGKNMLGIILEEVREEIRKMSAKDIQARTEKKSIVEESEP